MFLYNPEQEKYFSSSKGNFPEITMKWVDDPYNANMFNVDELEQLKGAIEHKDDALVTLNDIMREISKIMIDDPSMCIWAIKTDGSHLAFYENWKVQ